MEIEKAVRRMGLADTYEDRHWDRAVKVTDDTVQKAEPEWLEGLLAALLEVGKPTYPMRYGFEVALRRLASAPGDAGRVARVRALAAEGRTWGGGLRYDLPEVAEWLACAQPPEHLLAVFDDAEASDELAACLLQETALRYDATSAAGFAERLRAAGHPLAELPLRPTETERHLSPPRYPGLAQPWRPPGEGAPDAPGPSGLDIGVAAVDWPGARQALSAYRNWPSGADAVEAALFRLDRPQDPADFGASLLRLLPAASTGATVAGVRRVTTADVLRTLFSGAASGGAYGPRMHGAYARRASWESLAALADVEETGLEAIERAADRCTWLFYGSDWHLQVVPPLDAGIAVLRPDRRTVAVLAVTDSD
ncbi:DUF6183 family protein [Actinomadura mexicana]|uniref:Uncharacterized protein n=1 Tax=Actinomadura mexicana TaxID=134959 RepID=A0A238WLN9_9ACTN|nr:DUF6183 family protein [Actinomadura mexicana]SNR47480.1 hypothetical protein SAMN06265355_10343 [Actinomadura mexicana]